MVVSHRSNLPAEVTSFVGRRHELTEAKRLLEAHRLVTLTGPGGVGKTRLGLRVAAQVRRAFPDGVFLVDLTSLEDHLLLGDTVLAALGVVDQSARPAPDVLVEHLAERRVLLLLDNCEHLVDACTWLVDALLRGAPELRVLATSREPLRVLGQSVLEVAPARPDDAVELFEQRARAVLPAFALSADNRPLIADLCRQVDGLPLAIELAAARLRVLSVEQLLDRLADPLRVLTAPGSTGGRHSSMQATLEWSVQSCSKPERALWARLSVFAGDFDLDTAEYVCSGEIECTGQPILKEEILDLIAGLVDKSILVARRDGPVVRYSWLETLREYGRRLLTERGEELALRRRLRDWYRALVRPVLDSYGDSGYSDVFTRLRRDHANIRAALEFSVTEPGEARPGLDLAGALIYYWLSSTRFAEARHWLQRALDADPEPSPERTRALWAAGWIAVEQDEREDARRLLDEARRLATESGDEPALAWAVSLSGYRAFFAGELAEARPLLEEGVARHRALGVHVGVYATLSGLSQTLSYLDDPVSADLSAWVIEQTAGEQWAVVRSAALRNHGLELVRQGRLARAIEVLHEGLRIMRRLLHPYGTANFFEVLAWAAEADGEHERAARLLGAARAAYARIGASRPGPQRNRTDRYAAQARRALGNVRFAAAYRAGEELPEEDAAAYALGETRAARPPAAPRAAPRSPLTPRERQVVALVARGLSDNEIAAELVIARRTAESHVQHILRKLGFTTRAQIAAWAAQQSPE